MYHLQMTSRDAMLLALVLGGSATPAGAEPAQVEVSPQGRTHLAAVFGHVTVTADIVGHSLPIKSRTGGNQGDIRCTNSRYPCMLVDKLILRVGGRAVDIPRSVVVTLSDVNKGRLSAGGPNRYMLVLQCGDASEGYSAEIKFDRTRVLQRDVIAGEAGTLSERTVYSDLSHTFTD